MDRNFILAMVLSVGVLLLWQQFIAGPEQERFRAAQEAAQESAQQASQSDAPVNPDIDGLNGDLNGSETISVDDALTATPGRIPIRSVDLEGSINLEGGRIDDLKLTQYHETVDRENSPTIRLLSPRATEHGHYAQHGWIAGGNLGENALWTAPAGAVLTPDRPVTLTREKDGFVFEKTISVDDRYMFTVEQSVRNETGETQNLTPYALVIQRGVPEDLRRGLVHEGPVGIIGTVLFSRKYNTLKKNDKKAVNESGVGGWVGITNKYWLAAVVPPQNEEMKASLDNVGTEAAPIFRASYSLPVRSVAPGEAMTLKSHLFTGAKDVDILQSYEALPEKGGLGVYDFDKAVDWGFLFVLTRPIFYTLNFFGDLTGNFGLAILILTVLIKIILFPLANKGYESMSKMKKLQPEIEKLKERSGDDKTKMQQEMMELYKKEKMNPLAGCFPILLQMPVFFALYKTLFITIEMRHEPFILWIKDLSAPDPTTIFNLFGLLPFEPTAVPVVGAFLGIGVLPILMGVAMWFQTKLNPPPADPTQAQIFAMMPFVFVFIFAPFAAGLVLYWFWNTFLGIIQQWLIMKKNGVSVDLGERIKIPKFGKSGDSESK